MLAGQLVFHFHETLLFFPALLPRGFACRRMRRLRMSSCSTARISIRCPRCSSGWVRRWEVNAEYHTIAVTNGKTSIQATLGAQLPHPLPDAITLECAPLEKNGLIYVPQSFLKPGAGGGSHLVCRSRAGHFARAAHADAVLSNRGVDGHESSAGLFSGNLRRGSLISTDDVSTLPAVFTQVYRTSGSMNRSRP